MNFVDALTLTLGLDASGFVKAQKDVVSSLAKTKEQVVKASGQVEKSAVDMAGGISQAVKSLLDLGAAFLSTEAIEGFVKSATQANTTLANLSAGLGLTPQLLAAWGAAAEQAGGSAATMQSTIQSLSDSLVDLKTQGKALPTEVFTLEARSGVNVDFTHGIEAYTARLAKPLPHWQKRTQRPPTGCCAIGIDPVTARVMIQQGPQLQAYLKTLKKYGPNENDTEAATGLTTAWAQLSEEFAKAATKLTTALAPALEAIANWLSNVIDKVADRVEKNPGWTDAIAGVVAVLTGAGFTLAISNLLALAGALTALTTANAAFAGVGLLGLLARFGIVGAGVAAVGAVMNPGALTQTRTSGRVSNGTGKAAVAAMTR